MAKVISGDNQRHVAISYHEIKNAEGETFYAKFTPHFPEWAATFRLSCGSFPSVTAKTRETDVLQV